MKPGRTWIFLALFSTAVQAAQEAAVVTRPVEELAVDEPVVTNGEVRARYNLLLSTTLDGRLKWVAEEGSRVRKGTVVARVDDAQLRLQKQQQLLAADRADIRLRYLKGEVERLARLADSKLAPQTQLADLESQRDIAANDLSVARARIAELDEILSRTAIRSPIDGVVVRRLRSGGEFARTGEGVVRVVDPDSLEVLVKLPLNQFSRIRPGQGVTISLVGIEFSSRLHAIMPAGDTASQTFNAVAGVPARYSHLLAAGQFTRVTVPLQTSQKALFVPRDAVVLRSDGSYVFRIEDSKAKRIAVTLGMGEGDLVAVKGNLRAGDTVAVRGAERLADGQNVVAVKEKG